MIKDIDLKIGEREIVSDFWDNACHVERRNEGYFLVDNYCTFGPYKQVIISIKKSEAYLCGVTEKEQDFFLLGVNGLESRNYLETSIDIQRGVKQIRIDKELASLPGCKYLGEVEYYIVKDIPNSPFAKKDGLTRVWQENKCRNIYQTPDGKVFAVRPERVFPLERYRKFDTFEELSLYISDRGKEYSSLSEGSNRYLHELYAEAKFERNLPNSIIHKILNRLKIELPLEEFRNIKSRIKLKVIRRTFVDMDELYEAIKNENLDFLRKTLKEKSLYKSVYPIPSICMEEMEKIIKTHPSTTRYTQIDLEYEGNVYTIDLISKENSERLKSNVQLYEWQGKSQFFKDKPNRFEELCRLYNKRVGDAKRPKTCIDSACSNIYDSLFQTIEA